MCDVRRFFIVSDGLAVLQLCRATVPFFLFRLLRSFVRSFLPSFEEV